MSQSGRSQKHGRFASVRAPTTAIRGAQETSAVISRKMVASRDCMYVLDTKYKNLPDFHI